MDTVNALVLLAELDHEHCHLNHGPGIDITAIPATDYLVLPVGYYETADCDVSEREMVIPVCRECVEALQGEEWTLLYCYECNKNHWVFRKLARNQYRHHILWLKGCPDCTGEFGGLYFNDLPKQYEKDNLTHAVFISDSIAA